MTNVVTIVLVVLTALWFVFITYLYFRDKTLDDIRADVYQLFLKAEHKFTETGAGREKLQWVVQQAHNLLPTWMRFFVTEELLTMIVDGWFASVKDLLDDGKLNGSDDDLK